MEWMLLPFRRYFEFSGRSRRMEFWMFVVLNLIVNCVIFALLLVAGMPLGVANDPDAIASAMSGTMMLIIFGLAGLWALFVFIPNIALTIRRLHDRDMSGWWYLGFIITTVIPLVNILAAIGFVVLMALPGTTGPNRFGPDPLDPTQAGVFS